MHVIERSMEVDERSIKQHPDIGGLDERIYELIDAVELSFKQNLIDINTYLSF